jgi:hypothetical protein
MARNVYEFDDGADNEQQMNEIAKKLHGKTPKDVLLKLLKVEPLISWSAIMNAKVGLPGGVCPTNAYLTEVVQYSCRELGRS